MANFETLNILHLNQEIKIFEHLIAKILWTEKLYWN